MSARYLPSPTLCSLPLLLLFAVQTGCGSGADRDGDGFLNDPDLAGDYVFDCDDKDPEVGGGEPYFLDDDGDGLGDPARPCYACVLPEAGDSADVRSFEASAPQCEMWAVYVHNNLDCDDGNEGLGMGITWYRDADGDGLGDPSLELALYVCPEGPDDEPPLGYVANNIDCDDSSTWVTVDDVSGIATLYYFDADSDSFGDPGVSYRSCDLPAPGYVDNAEDCDDTSSDVSPAQPFDCGDDSAGFDDDCDNLYDEDEEQTWYKDTDGDGYGDDVTTFTGCPPPVGYIATGGDCDDEDYSVNPRDGGCGS